jgi:hypothetical protein
MSIVGGSFVSLSGTRVDGRVGFGGAADALQAVNVTRPDVAVGRGLCDRQAMNSIARVEALYDELLAGIAARAPEIGSRPVAVQWVHRGGAYRGTLILGQSVYGWADEWEASDFAVAADRAAIIAQVRGRNAEPSLPAGVTRCVTPDEPLRQSTYALPHPGGRARTRGQVRSGSDGRASGTQAVNEQGPNGQRHPRLG